VKFEGSGALSEPRERRQGKPPSAKAGEILALANIESKQASPRPPPRYTEALWSRNWRPRDRAAFRLTPRSSPPSRTGRTSSRTKANSSRPTWAGFVTDFLVRNFPDLMDVRVHGGNGGRPLINREAISPGWSPSELLWKTRQGSEKGAEAESVKSTGIPLDETCPKCGKSLALKDGRYAVSRLARVSRMPIQESLVKKESSPSRKSALNAGPISFSGGAVRAISSPVSTYPKCSTSKRAARGHGARLSKACAGRS